LPGKPTKKLSKLYTSPYKVIERIGCLAYKLDLPEHIKIHPILSVAQLKLARYQTDYQGNLYNHKLPELPVIYNK
jgi:hypothetical protein